MDNLRCSLASHWAIVLLTQNIAITQNYKQFLTLFKSILQMCEKKVKNCSASLRAQMSRGRKGIKLHSLLHLEEVRQLACCEESFLMH